MRKGKASLNTTLDLSYITYLFKSLYNSDIPICIEGTSMIKPEKSFIPLNMHFSVQDYKGLNNIYEKEYYKRIMITVYENSSAFSNEKDKDFTKLFALELFCELEEKWEYNNGNDMLVISESNFRIIETTDLYFAFNKKTSDINKGVEKIENWFNNNILVIEQYLNIK